VDLEVSVLRNCISILMDDGDYQKSIETQERVVSLVRDSLVEGSLCDELLLLGRMLVLNTNFAKAEHCYKNALKLKESAKDSLGIAQLLCTIADIHIASDNFIPADALMKRAVCLFEKLIGPESPALHECLSKYGFIQMKLERVVVSIDIYTRVLKFQRMLYQNTGRNSPISSTLTTLGSLLGQVGKHGEAQAMYLESLAQYDKMQRKLNPDGFCQVLNGLGSTYVALGDDDTGGTFVCSIYELVVLTMQ